MKDMFKLLYKGLHPRHHTQVRLHRKFIRKIRVENGVVSENMVDEKMGLSIRIYKEGAWGFAHSSEISQQNITNLLNRAFHSSSLIGKTSDIKPQVNPVKGIFIPDKVENDLFQVPLKDKVELMLKLNHMLKKKDQRIKAAIIRYTEIFEEKWIVNSEGTEVYTAYPNVEFIAFVSAEENGDREEYAEGIGITGGWKDLLRMDPQTTIIKVVKVALQNLHAPYPESGTHTVILGNELVGLLAHEAVGHTVEGDFILSGSIMAGKLGNEVASPLITLIDHPHPDFALHASGWTAVDDEGSLPKPAVIIENGILKGYMTDSITSAKLGIENTGNGRAWTYMDEPIVRMRNTYIASGNSSLQDMIEATEDGYYMVTAFGGGQADANAEFMFGVGEAYRIKSGKIAYPVKSATISGQAFDVLRNVDMVGNDLKLVMGTGYCGKFQPAKVDGGGPHIRTRMKIGGKQS